MAVNPVSQPYNWTFRRVVWATSGSCLFGLLLLAALPVLPGYIHPVYRHRDRHGHSTHGQLVVSAGLPRMAGVILVYLLLFVLLTGFLWLLFPLIFEQVQRLPRTCRAITKPACRNGNDPNQLLMRWGSYYQPHYPT